MKTHPSYSVGFSRLVIATSVSTLSLAVAAPGAEAVPRSPAAERARAGAEPYYFTENGTVEAAQFQLLKQSARLPPTAAEQRRTLLADMTRIPEDQRSITAIRNGARNYLQRWWQAHWEARRGAAAVSGPLHAAWHFYAQDESRLFGIAEELGIDVREVRPEPFMDESVLRQLTGPVPTSSDDSNMVLLRGLLSGPCNRQLADAIVSFVARMQQPRGTSPLTDVGNTRWRLVCESPDPLVVASVVDVACSRNGEVDKKDVLDALFWGVRWQRRELMTEEMVFRVIKECPQDALIPALERAAGYYLTKAEPAVRKAFFTPETPQGIRIALVGSLLNDDSVVRHIFDTSKGASNNGLVEAALRRYAAAGGPALIPHWLDIGDLVTNTALSTNARRAAVNVLQSRASSTTERGKKAAASLQAFASAPDLPAELRKAAADASLESARYRNALEERQREWQARSREDDSGQRLEQEVDDLREMLSKADRGEMSLSPDARTFMEVSLVVRARQLLLQRSLERLWLALTKYSDATEGRLPPDLDVLREATGFEARNDILFFPVPDQSVRRVPGDIILAIIQLPTDQREQSPPRVGVLFADGRVLDLRQDDFMTTWQRGNSLRSSIGVPPIEPRHLGKLAYLLAPQSQPTQPSPTTQPGRSNADKQGIVEPGRGAWFPEGVK